MGRAAPDRGSSLPTEAAHPRAGDLDVLGTEDVVALLLEEEARVAGDVAKHAGVIAMVAELQERQHSRRSRPRR